MNKAILIVICDFLVSAMLTMMTGMVPGHSGGTGVGLDESTTRVLLEELNRSQKEIDDLRLRLREAWERTGITPEQEAELRRISRELSRSLERQERLRAALPPGNGESAAEAELRAMLQEADENRKELEKQLADINRQLQDTSGKLRTHERDNAVLNRELARSRTSLEETGKKLDLTKDELLAETRKHTATREKLAASESSRLAAEKEAAESKKSLYSTQKELLAETRQHSSTREKLAASESSRAAAEEKAQTAGKELATAREELGSTRKAYDAERAAHTTSQKENIRLAGDLRRMSGDLRGVRDRLRNAEAANEKGVKEIEKWRLSAHETKSKLVVREQDFMELKDTLARKEQELLVEKLKRQDAETQRDMMKETTLDAVKQLSAKDAELSKSQQELAKKEGELKAASANPQGVAVAVPSENKVFECYAKSLVRVETLVAEKKFMGERTGKTVSFYPVVDFGSGRIMITGALNRFAGDWDVALKFDDVIKVQMNFAPPFESDGRAARPLAGRMLVSSAMPHLAGFKYSDTAAKPLKVLDAQWLNRVGVQDLFLFKSSSFESNTRLNGRVSLIPDANAPALFIRDIGRAGLHAEQGDFVLSMQGEFIGVVSGNVTINGVDGVLVPLIRDVTALWEQVAGIPLSKNPKEEFYSGYAAGMKDIRRQVKAGFDRH